MSREEYRNWEENGIYGLFRKKGKMKRMVWFATNSGYVSNVLSRKMYMNRKVSEAYQVVVQFKLRLLSEIPVRLKVENGYLNLGISIKYMDSIRLTEISVWDSDEWIRQYGFEIPIGYYQNCSGNFRRIYSNKELKNIVCNGNFRDRAWYIRADYYSKVRQVI